MKLPVQFKTIQKNSAGVYNELSSRFLAFAFPIADENKIREYRNQLKKTHYKAVHVVYAYRLGFSGEVEKSSDDGEPFGSAGLPVLYELRARELSYIVVFVVRYFGGKKLGVPGLIRSYKSATADVLSNNVIITKDILDFYKIMCDEIHLNTTLHALNRMGANVQEIQYGEKCNFTIGIKRSLSQEIESSLKQIWQAEYAYINSA